MALKHHWKFNNNLQDSVGDLHLTNVVGTPAYTSNKDGVPNSCLDNSSKWYAYSRYTTELSDAQRSYSLWIQTPSPSSGYCAIYQDKMYMIHANSNDLDVLYLTKSGQWEELALVLSVSLEGVIGEWINVCITINNDGVKKLFINGILKNIITNSISPTGSMSYGGVLINKFRNSSGFHYGNAVNIDEIKYFDHILTDGGVAAVDQTASADSEVWQLYLSGVNNVPAYTLNPATNITGTSAKLTWNES